MTATPMGAAQQIEREVVAAGYGRSVLAYLLHVALQQSYRQAGALAGLDEVSACRSCATVENLRDRDPHLDAFCAEIEQQHYRGAATPYARGQQTRFGAQGWEAR